VPHSFPHFHFRFVSLTFVAFFIALAVIVLKARPWRSGMRTVVSICSHFSPKSQAYGDTRTPPRFFHGPGKRIPMHLISSAFLLVCASAWLISCCSRADLPMTGVRSSRNRAPHWPTLLVSNAIAEEVASNNASGTSLCDIPHRFGETRVATL